MRKEPFVKRIVMLVLALALAPAATAQLYKWVDKDGKVTYSDQPPPSAQSKQINVPVGSSAAPAAAPKSAVAKDKELEKSRQAAADKVKNAEEAAAKAKADADNCVRAKAYLRTVTDGGRIGTYDEKGERVLLDDQQIEAERVKAQKAVDDYCKAS